MATRSRKGYWRMSQNELVQIALNNRWLEEQGVPDMNAPVALAARKSRKAIPHGRSAAESKQSGSFCTTGRRPESDWNRPVQCSGRRGGMKIPRSLTAWTKSKPYAGWCGTRELITPGDPIRPHLIITLVDTAHTSANSRPFDPTVAHRKQISPSAVKTNSGRPGYL